MTRRKQKPSKRPARTTSRAGTRRGNVANAAPSPKATRARKNLRNLRRKVHHDAKVISVVKPTPPRLFKRGRKARGLERIFITLFKAEGGIGSKASIIYAGLTTADYPTEGRGGSSRWRKKHNQYVQLQEQAPRGYPNAPGVWASNEGLFLGQVNFPGRITQRLMFKMLGTALGLRNSRGGVADFRDVYSTYSWHYKVSERREERYTDSAGIGRIRIGKARTIIERSGHKGKK